MKVTLINRDDSGGGAAMACLRLFKALKLSQTDVTMLVQGKVSGEDKIKSTIHNKFDKLRADFNFLKERLPFILKEQDKSVRFAFSTADSGSDITNELPVRNTDILHLHWTNGGFLSLDNLEQLFKLGKPVVWTLHDMWPFTGGCHYSGTSERFLQECGNCHFLKNPAPNDISHSGWLKKNAIYKRYRNITFVACSNWMRAMAKKSSLLKGFEVITIPNAIDTGTFSRQDKIASRKRWGVPESAKVILFGAANINHTRKGIQYLIKALHVLKESSDPINESIHVVVFGKSKGFDFSQLPFPVTSLPTLHAETDLAEVYSLADVFILPSLEDNLPNMVMEALSCSTPVVAFNSGGVNDMIDHMGNGYLAELMSPIDLAKGILFVLNDNSQQLAVHARKKIVENFSYTIIAEKHLQLYTRLLSENR